MKPILLSAVLLATAACGAADVRIYWIDVEGGAATLLVSPGGETVLTDAGWPGFDDRDPKRIVKVLKEEVGAESIDYFITSHFHVDHVGGLPALAKMVEIKKFLDHGDSVEKDWNERAAALWKSYVETAGDKREQVRPGETLPLEGVEVRFVAARGEFIDEPLLGGGENPLCEGAELRDPDEGENGKSVGFLARVGKFEFLDLGDLTWNLEHEISCPVNLLGEIDLYQVTHHGMHMSGAPQHIHAIKPRVAVMNNGHRKGGRPETYETLTHSPGLRDLWQVHKALEPDGTPNTDERLIANLEATDAGDAGNWIKAEVRSNGTFTITNGRNGFKKTYKPR